MSWIMVAFIAGGFIIVIGGGVILASLVVAASSSGDIRERINTYAGVPEMHLRKETRFSPNQLSRVRLRLNRMLSSFVSPELNLELSSANWPISETEFILIRFWLAIAGFFLGWLLFRSIFSGIGLAVLAYLALGIYLRNAIHQRRQRFEKQLIDVMVLLTGAVRAGYSLQQALDFVAHEMRPPASEEFHRVLYEISLAQPLAQALTNMSVRMQNDDLFLLVTALNINAQVGGNMVLMLKSVTETIRERVRLFGEIRTLTSQQRYNSYILTLLPVGIAAILFIFNPSYMMRIFQPNVWLCFPIGAVITLIIGNIVIRRLSKINV